MNEMKIKKKTYVKDNDLHILADKVIHDKSLNIEPAKIEYILVYPNINKTTAGRCIKNRNEALFLTGIHYIIEFSGDLWDNLDDERKEILMYHELLHVLPVMNEKTGDWDFKIRPHNVSEFSEIIKKFGIDWLEQMKTIHASVYDLNLSQMENFSL